MWLWQLSLQQWLSNQPKQQKFFYKIVALSFIAHFFLFFSFFFMWRDSFTACAFTLSKSMSSQAGAHIIVAPWKKERISSQSGIPASAAKQAMIEQEIKIAERKTPHRVSSKSKPAISTVVSFSGKKKIGASKKELRRKKLLADREKRVKERQEKKAAQELQKKLLAQKKEEQHQMALAMQASKQLATAVDAPLAQVTDSQAVYVTPNEFDALQILNELQEELQQVWQPPLGLSSDLACTITLVVDWQGKVNKVQVKESSGVPMYDLSASEALHTMKFPKSAFGKELTITFKQ